MQRRLCDLYAAPVIAAVNCQDIKTSHTQKIVNAAPTAGEGARVARMLSALVNVGVEGGYLANPRLSKVHWQPGDRSVPAAPVVVAGESSKGDSYRLKDRDLGRVPTAAADEQ